MTYMERVARFKRRLVERALRKHHGQVGRAAAMLCMHHNHLSVLMHRLGLKARDYKPCEGPELPVELRRDRERGIVVQRKTP
jgi:hypothetical protein